MNRLILWMTLALAIAGCARDAGDFTADELVRVYRASPLLPPPPDDSNAVADNPAAARLGQYLFFDARLSGNGRVSCATCHDPLNAFSDHKPLSQGMGTTTRNTPTLINVAYNRWFFWDGRADTLWSQALKPLEHPAEHGGSRLQFAHLMQDDPDLRAAYEAIFGPLAAIGDLHRFPARGRPVANDSADPLNRAWLSMTAADQDSINRIYANIGKSIEAYERLLISGNAPFDTFVAGLREHNPAKLAVLTPAARKGLKIFMGRGECHICHEGPNFTNLEFHSIGLEQRDWLPAEDYGRLEGVLRLREDVFNAAGPYSDARDGKVAEKLRYLQPNVEQSGQFKTPTLRNVALTAPYMHGGQFETLEQVMRFYSLLNEIPLLNHREMFMKPVHLRPDDEEAVVEFMKSLTGAPLPRRLLSQPASPR